MPSAQSIINVPYSQWINSFALPSHYTVGPTACEPALDACAIRQTHVTGIPLRIREDFTPDAFGGKYFVRLPRRSAKELHVSGRVARLRSEVPYFGSQSMCEYFARIFHRVTCPFARTLTGTDRVARLRRAAGLLHRGAE